LWPVPRGEEPNPELKVPFEQEPINHNIVGHPEPVTPEGDAETAASANAELIAFGSSEYAKVVLGGIWGQPPPLDLEAESDLQTLLIELAKREMIHSARDISDGGIAVALAQSAFPKAIGVTVDQEQALMVHPLFGLFAEPASTMLVSTNASRVDDIEELADHFGFNAARIGTTGGDRLEISVYKDVFVSAELTELRRPWSAALEATLHDEVTA
jgi:phosphoribosylformylglycinamidine synthase